MKKYILIEILLTLTLICTVIFAVQQWCYVSTNLTAIELIIKDGNEYLLDMVDTYGELHKLIAYSILLTVASLIQLGVIIIIGVTEIYKRAKSSNT